MVSVDEVKRDLDLAFLMAQEANKEAKSLKLHYEFPDDIFRTRIAECKCSLNRAIKQLEDTESKQIDEMHSNNGYVKWLLFLSTNETIRNYITQINDLNKHTFSLIEAAEDQIMVLNPNEIREIIGG